jgi:hypothetical protein
MRALLPLAALLVAPGVAHAKNVFPYNHPDLDWYTIETDHFFVHYPVSKKTAAQGNKHYLNDTWAAHRVAKVADEMWEPMCKQFDYYLQEKVHIVLLEQSDDLEGFTIPAWNWIEISGNPGGYFYRMRGRMEWFSDVLVHEFAHVVSLKRNAPFSEGLGGINIGGLYTDGIRDMASGGEVTVGDTDPFWWTEGGAEYWSDEAGYNWWTPARDMNLRTTVLDDRLLTYDEWVTRVDKRDWGDGERGYQQGYSFGVYMRERFGPKVYARFSQVSSEHWRANWETIVEEVTGVPLRTLYDDWVAYLKDKYGREHTAVKAAGEAEGEELEQALGAWRKSDPVGRDAWMSRKADTEKPLSLLNHKKKRRVRAIRERQRHLTGTWDFYPKTSDDGKWIGEHTAAAGFQFVQYPTALMPGIAGQDPDPNAIGDVNRRLGETYFQVPAVGSNFGHAFDFVPGKDAAVISGTEDMLKNWPFRTWSRVELDGYDWQELYVVDLGPNPKGKGKLHKQKHHGDKVITESRDPSHLLKGPRLDTWRFKKIPNTKRGSDPAVSPDGSKVAYLEYAAGTTNLVVIGVDGSEKTALTDFHDGTWLQNPDWSPDGKQLVFSMIRNFQQDLYIVDVATKKLVAINHDTYEDQDPHWAKDGSIWFSSDPEGIYNIYRYDPASKRVEQITNVIGGAECPWVTPAGDLLYTGFTAFGWKNYTLSRSEFVHDDVTGQFGVNPDTAAVEANLAYVEDYSAWEAKTEPYSALKSVMPPTTVPIFRFDNNSMTNFGLSAGAQIYAQDFVEANTMFLYGMLGQNPLLVAGYTYNGLPPTISLQAMHYEGKFDFGFLIDDDTTADPNDKRIFEIRNNQAVDRANVLLSYQLNGTSDISAYGALQQYSFRGTSDKSFRPFLRGAEAGVRLFYTNLSTFPYAANLRGGRAIELSLAHAYTDIADGGVSRGVSSDDGQLLTDYQYNTIQARWTEHAVVPHFWIPALRTLADHGHSIQWDTQVGIIDRNVQFFEEFRGGGTHPYYVGSGSLQPNNQFSGYPGYSLAGETMVVTSLAYRAPLMRQVNKKIGPLYVYDIYGQIGATAGNLWSYRPPDENSDPASYYYDGSGERVAYNPGDVRREIPFLDVAYKNGNRLLTDVNAEIRVSSTLFGGYWNSFVRLAYGFQRIKGINDVNGDDVQDGSRTGFGNALSSETEAPGPRIYIGLGTGW